MAKRILDRPCFFQVTAEILERERTSGKLTQNIRCTSGQHFLLSCSSSLLMTAISNPPCAFHTPAYFSPQLWKGSPISEVRELSLPAAPHCNSEVWPMSVLIKAGKINKGKVIKCCYLLSVITDDTLMSSLINLYYQQDIRNRVIRKTFSCSHLRKVPGLGFSLIC